MSPDIPSPFYNAHGSREVRASLVPTLPQPCKQPSLRFRFVHDVNYDTQFSGSMCKSGTALPQLGKQSSLHGVC